MQSDSPKVSTSRRLRPLYITAFLSNFSLWFAIEKLFLQHIGLDNSDITVVVIVFSVITALCNIPFGIVADRWSRCGVLIIGSVCMIIGCAIASASQDMAAYILASVFLSLYFCCESGAYDSLFYDTLLEQDGNANSYSRLYGRAELFNGTALGLSAIAGGLVSQFSNVRYAYLLTIPFSLLAIFFLLRFNEPTLHKKDSNPLIRGYISETFSLALKNSALRLIVLASILVYVSSEFTTELDQLWLLALAVPAFAYGPINAISLFGYGFGGLLASYFESRPKRIAFIAILFVVGSLGFVIHNLVAVVIAEIIGITLAATFYITLNKQLHDNLPSRVRNGSSSVVDTLGSTAFIPVALLFGSLSDDRGIFKAAWLVVIIFSLSAVGVYTVVNRRQRAFAS